MTLHRKRPLLVIDKNWVQAPGELVSEIPKDADLLVTTMLLHEILSTESDKWRKTCFRNLAVLNGALYFSKGLGSLLRYEITQQEKCTPLINKPRLVFPIAINPVSYAPEFEFNDEQVAEIKDAEQWFEGDLYDSFREMAAVTPGWFPELKEIKQGANRQLVDRIQEDIVEDIEYARKVYGAIRKPLTPPGGFLTHQWALLRRLQVYLIAGVDYCWRYGPYHEGQVGKDFVNQFLDIEYLVIATLADGFITKENRLRQWFKLLAPDKILLP